jgi:cell division protein FtsL
LIQADKRYIHGATAENLEYDVYEENKVLKEKKRRKLNRKAKFKAVSLVLLMFSLGFIIILRYAMITEISYKISNVNGIYDNLRKDNERLRVEIQSKTNLFKIEEIASSELKMQKPGKYQKVYIYVPKKDYSVVSDSYAEKEKNSDLLTYIGEKIDGIAQMLF